LIVYVVKLKNVDFVSASKASPV